MSLYLTSDTPTKEAVHLIRILSAGELRVWVTRMSTDEEGKRIKLNDEGIPFSSLKGRLRCKRVGSTLTYACAEADGPFQEFHSGEFGTEDLNMVRVGVENGNSKLAIDARFTDLSIRADGAAGSRHGLNRRGPSAGPLGCLGQSWHLSRSAGPATTGTRDVLFNS